MTPDTERKGSTSSFGLLEGCPTSGSCTSGGTRSHGRGRSAALRRRTSSSWGSSRGKGCVRPTGAPPSTPNSATTNLSGCPSWKRWPVAARRSSRTARHSRRSSAARVGSSPTGTSTRRCARFGKPSWTLTAARGRATVPWKRSPSNVGRRVGGVPSSRSREAAVVYSVCATNYNCANALRPHLASVVRAFDGLPFEYVVVDNFSRDGSWDIFQEWAASRSDVTLLRNRSTMGRGRNVAAAAARGSRIVVVDTDVVYRQEARTAVEAWDRICPDLAVQLPLLGLYPRPVWDAVGGRGDLNTYEDVDMWLRIHALGRMRWCLVPMGENLKEAEAH